MTQYTADYFRHSYYAVRGNEIAFRIDPADADLPWRTFAPGRHGGGRWRSDTRLAGDGWQIAGSDAVDRALAPLPEPAAPLTARQHLEAAWEAAHVPANGRIRDGQRYIARAHADGAISVYTSYGDSPAVGDGRDRRLIDPPRPPRPAGAAELDGHIDTASRGITDNPLTAEQVRNLADALASHGVRVPALPF